MDFVHTCHCLVLCLLALMRSFWCQSSVRSSVSENVSHDTKSVQNQRQSAKLLLARHGAWVFNL
jgi:hypothetical protein